MTKVTQVQNNLPQLATNVLDIPLGMIVKGKNVRTVEIKPDRFAETMESLKKNGQMHPIEVQRRQDGKYDLIAGYTRTAAAEALEWPTIRATVVEAPTKDPEKHRKIRGLAENLAREDLTPYDQAMAFRDLKKEHDMSGQSIGQHVGRSTSYVNNLVRIAESCEPVILDRWKKESDPSFGKDKEGKRLPNIHAVCTMDWLVDIAANVPRAEQEHALKKALGLIADDDDEGGDEDDEGGDARDPGAPKRASMKALKAALESAKEKAKADKKDLALQMAVTVLKFAIGHTKGIKDVYNPKEKAEKEDDSN